MLNNRYREEYGNFTVTIIDRKDEGVEIKFSEDEYAEDFFGYVGEFEALNELKEPKPAGTYALKNENSVTVKHLQPKAVEEALQHFNEDLE